MTKRSNRLPGAIITLLMVIASVVFYASVVSTQMVPTTYLVIFGIVLAGIVLLVHALVRRRRKRRRFLAGVCLTSVLMGIYAFGMCGVYELTSTMRHITNIRPEIAEMKVYVQTDDPAKSVEETMKYTYGILLSLDRDNTNKALDEINTEMNGKIRYTEYDSPTELIDALESGKVKAILMNAAFLALVEEQEGYTDIADRIREISVKQIETEVSSQPEENVKPNKSGVYTLYISGIDTRGSSLNVKSRSDVNIIATINTKTKEVLLLTTPRDYFVPLSISNGQPDKLTHAGLYGVNVSMETLEMLYDINIDYYFRLNFNGFVDIVNALGGVDVYNPKAFTRFGYTFKKGMNHVNGDAALIFARERYSYADGDTQRGKNQMELIRAMIEKMTTSTAMLTNFGSLMQGVEGSFETTVPYSVIATIVNDQLKTMDSWNIHSYNVTGTAAYRIPYSMSTKQFVWLPHTNSIETAQEMMATIREGGTLTETAE